MKKKLIPIIDCREGVWGIKPRNREQHFAFDALLDDRVRADVAGAFTGQEPSAWFDPGDQCGGVAVGAGSGDPVPDDGVVLRAGQAVRAKRSIVSALTFSLAPAA